MAWLLPDQVNPDPVSETRNPNAGFATTLTHGAGGSREAPLLTRICDEWAARGWLAVRYNLPYRRRRPKGPPSGSAATDQAGVVEAVELVRAAITGPVLAGGHSYGGRMTSMAVADGSARVDALTLFSYPLHPPGKPERSRLDELELATVPTLVVQGERDPFGMPPPASGRRVHVIAKAGHSLGRYDEVAATVTSFVQDVIRPAPGSSRAR